MSTYGSGLYGAGLYSGIVVAPIWPTMILEWAPADPPTAETPTWVDITDKLLEWEWGYGRNDDTGEFEAGTGYVLLSNQEREFDPSNTAGPWYGNIKPRRMFRLLATWDAVTYPIFVAHARGFPQAYPFETSKVVRVELADALALLRGVDLDALGFDRPQERSDERLDAVLDEAGIPDWQRNLDVGTVTVGATSGTEIGTGLEHVKSVANSEYWPVYVTRAGQVAML